MSASPDLYDAVRRLRAATDGVLVSYSGGKDSAVVLDLVCRGVPQLGIAPFKHVVAFFLYRVPGLAYQQGILQAAAEKYGITVLQYPHPQVSLWLRTGMFREAPDYSIRRQKLTDTFRRVRADTGLEWIAGGEKRADSLWRRGILAKYGVINGFMKRAYLVGEWKKHDILAYVKRWKLPLSADTGCNMNLVSMHGNTLYELRRRFPEDYQRVLKMFPYAEAAVFRYERQLERATADAARTE